MDDVNEEMVSSAVSIFLATPDIQSGMPDRAVLRARMRNLLVSLIAKDACGLSALVPPNPKDHLPPPRINNENP